MPPIVTPAQRTASILRRAERALLNWQDDPEAPHADVDKMLAIIADLRQWVQGHIITDIERVEGKPRD